MKLNLLDNMPTPEGVEDETEETGSDDVVESKNNSNSKSKNNNGDSHGKLSSSTSNGDKVLDEDSNISVGVSNASEVEDEDSRSVDEVRRQNNGTNRLVMNNPNNSRNTSAYNCIEDSKDGMRSDRSIVDENYRQQSISNGDNSNLSYSNLSSDDLNNSTTDNTADNTLDGPTNLSISTTNTNTNTNTNTTTITSANATATATATVTPTINSSSCNSSKNNSDNNNIISSTISPDIPLLPFGSLPPPPQVAVPVEMSEAEGEPISSIINGHSGSNGETCKNIDKSDSEIDCNTVCSSVDGFAVSNSSIKRPLEEITSSGDGLENNGSLEKKTRND